MRQPIDYRGWSVGFLNYVELGVLLNRVACCLKTFGFSKLKEDFWVELSDFCGCYWALFVMNTLRGIAELNGTTTTGLL